MICLQLEAPSSPENPSLDYVQGLLQQAVGIELGTLPPYLYAKFSIMPGTNAAAMDNLSAIVGQEMVHLCLACNMLNAIGGRPKLEPRVYPTTLPGDIGPPDGEALMIHLLRFSRAAMEQGMAIEEPSKPIDIPDVPQMLAATQPGAVTIGEFYTNLESQLAKLPASVWQANRNQITDDQFFPGQLFAINSYADAKAAISLIVSEGEGATDDPLDFQREVAHYYRFEEIAKNKVLTKADNECGYVFGPQTLEVDWTSVYPAIPDPAKHDFGNEPEAAQMAQKACNRAYSALIDSLQAAIDGEAGALGRAVRAMFDLRLAATVALSTPLSDGILVAGPSFVYSPTTTGETA